MFSIGDLVTVDSDTLRLHVNENTYKQWKSCTLGIVVQVEGHFAEGENATTILVKVYFQSLGSAYWLYAREVILLSP